MDQRASNPKAKIVLGVSGCIAAYKMPQFVRTLIKNAYDVKVLMSASAHKFVTPTSLAAVSQNKVYQDPFDAEDGWFPAHIDLAEWADLVMVAPLSANVLSQVVTGSGADLLLSTLLAYAGPVLFAPSMNDQMYRNPMVQDNLKRLNCVERYHVMAPEEGFLACLSDGPGRLPDDQQLLKQVEALL